MRILEILIVILMGLYYIWTLLPVKYRHPILHILPAMILLVGGFHLVIEKYRWQMIPLYILALITFLFNLYFFVNRQKFAYKLPRLTIFAAALPLTFLLISALLPILLPVPKSPPPSGPYKVGTVTYVLVDESRFDPYSSKPDDPRKIMIQVWYPALPDSNSDTTPWLVNAKVIAPAIARWIKMPDFFLDHLVLSQTSSFRHAAADRDRAPYPILIFSHGWGGFRSQNNFQVQQLASHGYVVVGMEHTYGTVVTVFPDGQVAYNNPATLPRGLTEEQYVVAAQKLGLQWSGDIAFTLDYLEKLTLNNPNSLLGDMIDFDHVGVIGHSTGGGAIIQFCATDARCKAGLSMDAYMPPVSDTVLDNGLSQQFFFMFSENWSSEKNTKLFNRLYSNLPVSAPVITIKGTKHYDFSDLPMLTPLAPQLGLKGPLKGARVLSIVNSYSLAFFDLYLKGKPSPLLEGPSSLYPEILFSH